MIRVEDGALVDIALPYPGTEEADDISEHMSTQVRPCDDDSQRITFDEALALLENDDEG